MRKLTVFIEGDSKTVELDKSILVTGNSHLLVKTAMLFWNYNNVFTGFNNRFTGYRGRITIPKGYWTFQMLAHILKVETESPDRVEINRGLRYVEVSCNIVDSSWFIGPHGKWSSVISTLPITTDVSLKGSVVHYKDIENRVPISKGIFNAVWFNVCAN